MAIQVLVDGNPITKELTLDSASLTVDDSGGFEGVLRFETPETDPVDTPAADVPPVEEITKDEKIVNRQTIGRVLTYAFPESLSKYRWQNREGAWRQANVGGRPCVRVGIDFNQPPTKQGGNRYRTEFLDGFESEKIVEGGIYRMSEYVWVPGGLPAMPKHIVWQLHGKPDKHLGEGYRNPTLGIYANGKGSFQFYCNYDSTGAKVTKKSNVQSSTFANVKLGIQRWNHLEIEWRNTWQNTGWARAYINGEPVGRLYKGPTRFKDQSDSYDKSGIYFFNALPGRQQKFGDLRPPEEVFYFFTDYGIIKLPVDYAPAN